MNTYSATTLFIATLIAALILTGLCLVLPVYQWYRLGDTLTLKTLAALAALAIGICKITFIPIAVSCVDQRKYLGAACLFIVGVIALGISISATKELFNNSVKNHSAAAAVSSIEYQTGLTELKELNNEIDVLQKLLDDDQKDDIRKRAYAQRENLDKLRNKRAIVVDKLKVLSSAPQNTASHNQTKNLTLTIGKKSVTLSAPASAAITLHLACIFSLLAITHWNPAATAQHPQIETINTYTTSQTASASTTASKKTDKPKQQKGNNSKPLDNDQEKLAARVIAGEFSNAPVLRNLIEDKAIRGGYNKIKPVFDHLEKTGNIKKTNTGYVLTQATI